ncbi:MAG: PilW family protein [Phycisphaerales bacterium]
MRRGFSLIELVLGMAIASIAMVAIGSVFVLSAKALPTARGSTSASSQTSLAVQELLDDLRMATAVSEATGTAVTLTVPDRTGDNTPETVRYAWSGVAGGPLTRAMNGGAETVLVPTAYGMSLEYSREPVSVNVTIPTPMTSGTVLMAEFTGWSGVTHAQVLLGVSTSTWGSQAFTINRVTLPATTTAVRLTRVDLRLKRNTRSTSNSTVNIHQRASLFNAEPGTTPIGTGGVVLPASLGASAAMMTVPLTGVSLPIPAVLSYCIVMKGLGSQASCDLAYYNANAAPTDLTVFLSTGNSGNTWTPSNNTHRNDAPFAVYGEYDWTGSNVQTTTTYLLRSATVKLQTGRDAGSALVSSVVSLNKPGIPGP